MFARRLRLLGIRQREVAPDVPISDADPNSGARRGRSNAGVGQGCRSVQRRGRLDCVRGGAVLDRIVSVCGSVTESGAAPSGLSRMLPQQTHGPFADRPHRLRDRRQRRVDTPRESDVVEADDRQIERHAQAPPARRLDRAHRHLVVEAEDRCRRIAAAEQPLGADRAGLDREVAVHHDEIALGALLLAPARSRRAGGRG